MWIRSLGQEDPLEKEMATHSSILAWEIPPTRDWRETVPGVKESDMTQQLNNNFVIYGNTLVLSGPLLMSRTKYLFLWKHHCTEQSLVAGADSTEMLFLP